MVSERISLRPQDPSRNETTASSDVPEARPCGLENWVGFDLPGGVVTVHNRHLDVHQDQIRPLRFGLVDAGLPIRRFKHLVTRAAEKVAQDATLALTAIVTFGSLTVSMLPFLLKRMGLDPATASAPFVATLVDVTALVIYFTVAYPALRGTLL